MLFAVMLCSSVEYDKDIKHTDPTPTWASFAWSVLTWWTVVVSWTALTGNVVWFAIKSEDTIRKRAGDGTSLAVA